MDAVGPIAGRFDVCAHGHQIAAVDAHRRGECLTVKLFEFHLHLSPSFIRRCIRRQCVLRLLVCRVHRAIWSDFYQTKYSRAQRPHFHCPVHFGPILVCRPLGAWFCISYCPKRKTKVWWKLKRISMKANATTCKKWKQEIMRLVPCKQVV